MRTGPCVWDPGWSWRVPATSLSVVETRDAERAAMWLTSYGLCCKPD